MKIALKFLVKIAFGSRVMQQYGTRGRKRENRNEIFNCISNRNKGNFRAFFSRPFLPARECVIYRVEGKEAHRLEEKDIYTQREKEQ